MDMERIADDLRNGSPGFGVYDVGVTTSGDGTRSIEAPLIRIRPDDAELRGSFSVDLMQDGRALIVIADEAGATRIEHVSRPSAEVVRAILMAHDWELLELTDEASGCEQIGGVEDGVCEPARNHPQRASPKVRSTTGEHRQHPPVACAAGREPPISYLARAIRWCLASARRVCATMRA